MRVRALPAPRRRAWLRRLRARLGPQKYGVEWQSDAASPDCSLCAQSFNVFRRRHHCRACGKLVCDACSRARRLVRGPPNLKRVCDGCVRAAEDASEADAD